MGRMWSCYGTSRDPKFEVKNDSTVVYSGDFSEKTTPRTCLMGPDLTLNVPSVVVSFRDLP